MELISVIVPIYKVEAYLKRCVDSILAQTYENLEILLIDGSPDGCPAICDAYEQTDKRVRAVHQKNKGLSGARNTGIDLANGAYLAFVDSDDFLAPDYVETLYRILKEQKADLSQCRYEKVTGDAFAEKRTEEKVDTFTGRAMMMQMYAGGEAYFTVAWNKLYRRELFAEIRYPEGRIHEDEATTYRIYDLVRRAAVTDLPLYGYFVREESITGTFRNNRLDWLTALEERIDFYREKGYTELMLPTLCHYADGNIHLYMQYRRAGLSDSDQIKRFKKNVGRVPRN